MLFLPELASLHVPQPHRVGTVLRHNPEWRIASPTGLCSPIIMGTSISEDNLIGRDQTDPSRPNGKHNKTRVQIFEESNRVQHCCSVLSLSISNLNLKCGVMLEFGVYISDVEWCSSLVFPFQMWSDVRVWCFNFRCGVMFEFGVSISDDQITYMEAGNDVYITFK